MGVAKKVFVAADLFCGGGGFSKGFALACAERGIQNIRLIAVNHSQVAIESHRANHPWAEHHCARVDQLDPRKLVPEGRMKILIASPECTNHANARGGRPINDQSRATAWDVVKWAQELYIETILIENVREIMEWGPLGADNKPLKSKKGDIFRAWIDAIRKCGYTLDHRILNAADFGAATTRKRFFLIAKRAHRKIVWPEQTHAKDADKTGDLFKGLKQWRGACEIINWTKKGVDILEREQAGLKPLRPNTMARIEAGIRKFWGTYAEAFIIQLRGTQKGQIEGSARSVKRPLPGITAGGIHAGLVQPFIITPGGADLGVGRTVDQPLPTVLCHERFAMVEPFVLQQQSGGAPRSTRKPLPSISGSGAQALVQPFIIAAGGPEGQGRNPKSVKDPLGTVMPGDHKALIQPFIVPFFGERQGQAPRTHSIEQPLPAITSHGAGGLVEPFIVQVSHGTSANGDNKGRVQSIRKPLGTVTGENGHGLVQPMIVSYNSNGKAHSTDKPLPTITGHDRFGLVTPMLAALPKGYELRAYFRMFDDDELARAMGFDGYEFKGTKKQRILMIGNAVEVNTAKALVKAILE